MEYNSKKYNQVMSSSDIIQNLHSIRHLNQKNYLFFNILIILLKTKIEFTLNNEFLI